MTKQETLIAKARAELGTRETPPGSNNVKYNTAYYGKAVSGAAYAWCCAFVWWCFQQAGLSALFFDGKKTNYCPDVHNWARKNRLIVSKNDGQPGDIILFDWSPRNGLANHIGIIEKRASAGYQTIEGNWNNCVCRVTRETMSDILAVIRPRWGAKDNGKPSELLTTSEKRKEWFDMTKNYRAKQLVVVYADSARKQKVGEIFAGSVVTCIGEAAGMAVVLYSVTGTGAKKVGFADAAGVQG
jgi:hypothetical protein